MTGYERSPDYGSPPVTWRTYFAALFAILIMGSVCYIVGVF